MENNPESNKMTQNPAPRKPRKQGGKKKSGPGESCTSYWSCCLSWCKTHVVKLKGLAAIILGLVLVFSRRKYLIEFGVGIAGIMLIYYGLSVLRLTQITNIFDRLVGRIRR